MAKATRTPGASRSRPRRGAGRDLSRGRIADAALAMAARGENLDEVTMRDLATELGVGTMTIYGYFRSKDELIDAALDRAAEEVRLPPRTGPWKAQLRALMGELYRTLRKYPSGVQVRARRPILSPGALRTTNAGLGIMVEAGFDNREATRAWRSLFTYTFGFVAFTPASVPDELTREWGARLADLDLQELPWMVDAIPEAMKAMSAGADQYYHGLDLLLDGLERRLSEPEGKPAR